jgi:archaellum component FlaC
MFSEFREYLISCPLVKQNYQLDAEAGIYTVSVSKATLTVNRSWSTIDEGLNELERRIEDLRTQINANRKESFEAIDKLSSGIKTRDGETKELIKQVSLLLDKSVMGDAKLQILGALLVLYGVIVDIFL